MKAFMVIFINLLHSRIILSVKWYPQAEEPMLGEQVDLVGAGVSSFNSPAPNWTETTGIVDFGGEVDPLEDPLAPVDPVIPKIPVDIPGNRDREPLDDVEDLDPKQWPLNRPQIPNSFRTTTQFPMPRRNGNPTTLAQRNPSTQR